MKTQVIIIGTGPSSLFAAIELVNNGCNDILMLEAGSMYEYNDPERSLTQLFGGASTNSDGKLTFHHQVGTTFLPGIVGLKEYYNYMERVEQIYLDFKPTKAQREIIQNKKNNEDVTIEKYIPTDEAKEYRAKALANNMDMLTYNITHLGSDAGFFIGRNIYDFLIKSGVEIICDSRVTEINKNNDLFEVHVDEKKYISEFLIVGIGRSGADDFSKFMRNLNVPLKDGQLDCGVRVEVPNEICSGLLKAGIYEPKMIARTKTYEDKVRTFCWNYAGEVVAEKYPHYGDLVVANGHSLAYSKTDNTNFALLVTKQIPNPLEYLKTACKTINILADGKIMIQRLGDLRAGRRSTEKRINEGGVIPTCDAYPGDLSLGMSYRHLLAVLEMLEMMDKVLPGINGKYTLLYGLEAKFYTNDVEVNKFGETVLENLYAVGDGSGKTRGQVASSTMGLMSGRGILNKIKGI